jgi:ribosomal protein S18 acetylase RimI-like enzyme
MSLAVSATPSASPPLNRLVASQHRRAGEMLARAFYDDPLSIYLASDEARRRRVLPWLYEHIIRYGAMHDGVLLVTGDLDGAAVWLPPGLPYTPMSRLVRAGLALAPLKFGIGSIGRFMAANTVEQLRAKLAPEPHWYLWVIGVDPEHQGRGLGTSLVEPMLAQADADGLPCYLETHKERNVGFYEKHGYNIVHSGRVPKAGPAYWCLKREPRR